MSNKKPKPPRNIKPHKSKYSENFLGFKERNKLELMLQELLKDENFKSSQDYQELKGIKPETRDYYQKVRIFYTRYIF